ncbi:MAG: tRNA uridine-5-carboxymethylaminomethyl(34) synthesis GTPase MnmE, partial [Paludibacteraceae bacterium]|nr:tRNA uridine-5-carboxymethylaminomethyl(34) synthesis GTPase MnmE [Paludibacteraceae bacterium]
MINHLKDDTIAAISTAPGVGGIAVIRISGNQSIEIVSSIFKANKKDVEIKTASAYQAIYGTIYECEEEIDKVVVSLFRAPHSFTGEDVVEISCHGSIYIQQRILSLLINKGCRLATAGEFTQRAFFNGKMDLSQAEAVADLINSQTKAAHSVALNQMKGTFSNKLSLLREKLLHLVSLLELELDFGDHEELEFADRKELIQISNELHNEIKKLTSSFSTGNAIKNGIPVSIIGNTNVGKSTLLNHLIGEEKAIVSDIPGTTRDIIEDVVNINGISFRFIDTAGIRSTSDTIEKIGIERSYNAINHSQIVIWVIDGSNYEIEKINDIKQYLLESGKIIITVINKIDIATQQQLDTIKLHLSDTLNNILLISAKKEQYIEELTNLLYEKAGISEDINNDIIVNNVRHYEALQHSLESIERIIEGLNNNIPSDFIAQDARETIHYLSEITGG